MVVRDYELVIGIGDLHGHRPALDSLLTGLQSTYRLFSNSDRLKLRKGVALIETGDFIDRGRESRKVIDQSMVLKAANPTHVRQLMGNHEILALESFGIAQKAISKESDVAARNYYCQRSGHGHNHGDLFVNEFDPDSFRNALTHYLEDLSRNSPIGKWMRALEPFAQVSVDGRSIVFVHAGIPDYVTSLAGLKDVGLEIRSHLDNEPNDPEKLLAHYQHPLISREDSLFENRNVSLFGYSAQIVADKIGADYFVFGHTPNTRIVSFEDRGFNIDVGMNPYNGGHTPAAIVFKPSGVYGFYADRGETMLVEPLRTSVPKKNRSRKIVDEKGQGYLF